MVILYQLLSVNVLLQMYIKFKVERVVSMAMQSMTPEEVLKHGKRIQLFPDPRSRVRKTYLVQENGILVQHKYLDMGEGRTEIFYEPAEINEIYKQIEHVYSARRKGVLIARRSGSWKSNRANTLPLRWTPKGIGLKVKKVNELAVYETLEHPEQRARKRQTKRVGVG